MTHSEVMQQVTAVLTGKELRDQGTEAALENAGATWHERATELALEFFKSAGAVGALFEQARAYAKDKGLGAPPSPNAWGAVCLGMSKRKFIVKTGALLASGDPRSHARAQPVWRIAG